MENEIRVIVNGTEKNYPDSTSYLAAAREYQKE